MGSDYTCNLTLGFSSGRLDQNNKEDQQTKEEKDSLLSKYDHIIIPSLSLELLQSQPSLNIENKTIIFRGIATSTRHGSSYSNSSTIKKEKVVYEGNEFKIDKTDSPRTSDEDEEASPRKKLRLTKEQSVVLEDSFKDHSTLNPIEKQALARQLNLRPRQVEVWFQNRRARTKLKQTEMDFEFLKKCFQTLTEDNKRLHKEVVELRALKTASPATTLYMHMPAATLTMCPACERIIDGCSNPTLVIKPQARLCSMRPF